MNESLLEKGTLSIHLHVNLHSTGCLMGNFLSEINVGNMNFNGQQVNMLEILNRPVHEILVRILSESQIKRACWLDNEVQLLVWACLYYHKMCVCLFVCLF